MRSAPRGEGVVCGADGIRFASASTVQDRPCRTKPRRTGTLCRTRCAGAAAECRTGACVGQARRVGCACRTGTGRRDRREREGGQAPEARGRGGQIRGTDGAQERRGGGEGGGTGAGDSPVCGTGMGGTREPRRGPARACRTGRNAGVARKGANQLRLVFGPERECCSFRRRKRRRFFSMPCLVRASATQPSIWPAIRTPAGRGSRPRSSR